MRLPLTVLAAIALVAFAACGDDDDGGDDGGGSTVDIELVDFAVAADPESASAGEITFEIANTGPDHPHEFVVIRTELDAAELPTTEHGAVDEASAEIEVVDEVEEIEVDATATLTVDLEAGHYALICNIVPEESEMEGHGAEGPHYELGMHTNFTVE